MAHVPPANFARAGLSAGFERLMRAGTHLRGCHDCWSHAMAARGALDALVELGLNRWDIAATEVIVEEAGALPHPPLPLRPRQVRCGAGQCPHRGRSRPDHRFRFDRGDLSSALGGRLGFGSPPQSGLRIAV